MDVCDSTFPNTTTFKSLPQAFHKPQACTCLQRFAEWSSAAWGRIRCPLAHLIPVRSTRGCAALPGRGKSQPGAGSFSWTHHWPPLSCPSACPTSQPVPAASYGPPGAAAPVQQLWGCSHLLPTQHWMLNLTCSLCRRKASRE